MHDARVVPLSGPLALESETRAAMLVVPPATTAETDESASQKLDLSEVIELLLDSTDNEFDAPVRKLLKKSNRPVKRITSPGRFRAPREEDDAEPEDSQDAAASAKKSKQKEKSKPKRKVKSRSWPLHGSLTVPFTQS